MLPVSFNNVFFSKSAKQLLFRYMHRNTWHLKKFKSCVWICILVYDILQHASDQLLQDDILNQVFYTFLVVDQHASAEGFHEDPPQMTHQHTREYFIG